MRTAEGYARSLKSNLEWQRRNRRRVWAYNTILGHRKKGCIVTFDHKWLTEKAEQTEACPYCEAPLEWNGGERNRPGRPTLDRMNNSLLMTKRNVAIVCGRCNVAKGKDTLANYLRWLRRRRS